MKWSALCSEYCDIVKPSCHYQYSTTNHMSQLSYCSQKVYVSILLCPVHSAHTHTHTHTHNQSTNQSIDLCTLENQLINHCILESISRSIDQSTLSSCSLTSVCVRVVLLLHEMVSTMLRALQSTGINFVKPQQPNMTNCSQSSCINNIVHTHTHTHTH